MGRNHIDARLGLQCYLAIWALKRGPFWGSGGPIWDPLLEGYMGRNHIDARLGHQCHYGVLGPFGVPHSGGTPNPWGMGYGPLFAGIPGIWGIRDMGYMGYGPLAPAAQMGCWG